MHFVAVSFRAEFSSVSSSTHMQSSRNHFWIATIPFHQRCIARVTFNASLKTLLIWRGVRTGGPYKNPKISWISGNLIENIYSIFHHWPPPHSGISRICMIWSLISIWLQWEFKLFFCKWNRFRCTQWSSTSFHKAIIWPVFPVTAYLWGFLWSLWGFVDFG